MAKSKVKAKVKAAPKRGPGQPKWIPTPEIIKEVESYGSLGMTSEQIALCLGISVASLCNKQNEYVEFFEAIKRGKAKGIALVTSELIKNVKAKNVTAQIFYLKCQAKWKETQVLEVEDISQAQALKEIE
jgi:hypothetical protein